MATYSNSIDTYRVVLFGNGNSSRPDYIYCRCNNGTNAYLFFWGNNIPTNSFANGTVRLYFPESKFEWILDILRNEKPVYYHYNTAGNTGYLKTIDEPIGEGEDEE